MAHSQDRLDGWKAIARFFGRERTTVIRWARERGMPVHAFPGGKTRTVFALVSELDTWIRSQEGSLSAAEGAGAQEGNSSNRTIRHGNLRSRWVWGLACACAAMIAAAGALSLRHADSSPTPAANQPLLPGDAAVARLYVQARDDWAERTAASLSRSVQEFQRVTDLAPRFAPAFAALADSYLLGAEAGSLPQAVAFDGAQHAADDALRLDPTLAAAHRAEGYILYWWRHSPVAAGVQFREAIRLMPDDAQTHFWYANILADNGDDGPAMREFDRARLAEPGSDQIGADYAWALWTAGHGVEALARLRAITAINPNIAEAQDCLADVALARGDYPLFLDALRREAQLRRDADLASAERRLAASFARGGGPTLLVTAFADEMRQQAQSPHPDHSTAAFYISLAGDRRALLQVLQIASGGHERWGSAGYRRNIVSRWRGDGDILGRLRQLSAPAVEPPNVSTI